MRLNPHRPLHAVLDRFPGCRVIRRLESAVTAVRQEFLARLPRFVQADQPPVTILE